MTIERFEIDADDDLDAFEHGDPRQPPAVPPPGAGDGQPVARPPGRWRDLAILAQDPTVKSAGKALRAKVRVPREALREGPRGHRLQVVDFDSTSPSKVVQHVIDDTDAAQQAFLDADDGDLIASAPFRAQNVYAIASRTLDSFEQALGRRVPWSHAGHQLYLVPAAFREANAFYDPDAHAVFFGYYDLPAGPWGDGSWAYTSLSHDIVAHEMTHAVLDGLRARFSEPGLPDQAAFHEAFADIVALLSTFAMPAVVERLLRGDSDESAIPMSRLTEAALQESPLLGLGEQLGDVLGTYGADQRGSGLRRSVKLAPNTAWLRSLDYDEPHLRGEVLVAAMTQTLVAMWVGRLDKIRGDGKAVDPDIAVEEGAKAAEHLLRMAIRAIDYTPPLEFCFPDFLDAMLVSDAQIAPDDEHHYREALRAKFRAFGIVQPEGQIVEVGAPGRRLEYSALHADELRSSPDEVYRFIWDNFELLGIPIDQYLEVDSIWSSTRIGPDGFVVREVVATYFQVLEATVAELGRLAAADDKQFQKPRGVDAATFVKIFGGGALIFDQWGRPKFHQTKRLFEWPRQKARLEYLARSGFFDHKGRLGFGGGAPEGQRFAILHAPGTDLMEAW